MKITLIEETTKIVKPSRVQIFMLESEAHQLLEALVDYSVPDNGSVTSPLYKLWVKLNEELHLVQGQKKPVKAGSKAFRRGPYAPFNGPKRQKRAIGEDLLDR